MLLFFCGHLRLYRNLVCGFRQSIQGLPRGLEYALLTTELAAKTCYDTGFGKQRMCLIFFTCFLVLPDKINDRQKNGRGQPETPAIPELAHFNLAFEFLKHQIGDVQPGLGNLPLNAAFTQDEQKPQRQKARNSAKTKLLKGKSLRTLKTGSGKQTAHHAMTAHIWRWINMDLRINSHCLTCD